MEELRITSLSFLWKKKWVEEIVLSYGRDPLSPRLTSLTIRIVFVDDSHHYVETESEENFELLQFIAEIVPNFNESDIELQRFLELLANYYEFPFWWNTFPGNLI